MSLNEDRLMMIYRKYGLGILRLAKIHGEANIHEYFAAGVWNVEFIRRCIAEGIDPELALEMSKEGGAL